MKRFNFFLIFILIISLFFNIYQNKQKKDYQKKLIEEKHKIQKMKTTLDSLQLFLIKQSTNKINKNEIREYLKTFLTKRENKFLPDIFPIKSQFEISQKYSKKHPAIDLAAEEGTEVYATATGVVDTIYFDKFFGNTIILNHLNEYKTKYSHLAKIFVFKHYCVKKGNLIGLVGSTGRSSAPHLHYEIFKNNKNIDPLKIIKRD